MNQQFCEYPGTGGNVCHNPVAAKVGDRLYCKKHGEIVESTRDFALNGVFGAKEKTT